jgi:predicted MFS family arabinose efflux permease
MSKTAKDKIAGMPIPNRFYFPLKSHTYQRDKLRMVESTKNTSRFLAGLRIAAFFNTAQEMALVILFPAIRDSLGLNYLSLGILDNIRLLLHAAGAPLWKLIVERGNRKWLLAVFAGLWGIWTLGCGLAVNFWPLLILRFAACLGFGCFIPLATSLVKDAFNDSQSETILQVLEVGKILGLVVMAIMLAELLNITAIGWRYGFAILGGFTIVGGGYIAIRVKIPQRPVSIEKPASRIAVRLPIWVKDQFISLVEILKHPTVWLHLFQGSLVTTTVNTLVIFSVTWLVDIKHLSQIDAPFVFAAMLVSMAVGSQVGSRISNLAETRWPKFGRIATAQAAILISLPVMAYLLLKANSLPLIFTTAIFMSFFLNWNRHSLQEPQIEALIHPALHNKAAFWIDLLQTIFAAAVIIAFSHYADNRNLTDMLRILGIYFWATALAVTTIYYVIYPLELRHKGTVDRFPPI